RVLIPVTQLHLIQKYVSAEGKEPRIHKLGGTTWAKTKTRVQKQVEDIADELIELYAERESRKGFAFSKNDAYYRAFEEAFPYTETHDQLRLCIRKGFVERSIIGLSLYRNAGPVAFDSRSQ